MPEFIPIPGTRLRMVIYAAGVKIRENLEFELKTYDRGSGVAYYQWVPKMNIGVRRGNVK